ncbi:MAG TPA: c-type cytochrome [Rhodanobacteraceae bacterium]|jgi:cytochrome c553|nr:c-type cytochrome [Rhodanobacteraceae bacterium]
MRRNLLRALIALVVVALAIAGFVFARSEIALHDTWAIDESALAIPNDADAIVRGEHVAITRGCPECHEKDFGGKVVMESPPIGRMAAPNVTRGEGGLPADFADRDFERAIRHGVKPDGHALLFMPARDFAGLSDADTADLIAYVKQRPPVDRELAPSYIGPLGRALFAFGQLPMLEARMIDQHAAHVLHMETASTIEYGRYLAQSCTGCHGEHFSGGAIPGVPPDFPKPLNITPDVATGIGSWSKEDFYRVFREGKKPDGSAIDPFMPWPAMGKFTDTELEALWAFERSIPARAAGQR